MRSQKTNGGGSVLRPGRTTLDTGMQGVVSNDTATPIFNALTGPLNSAQIQNVRTQIYLAAVGALEVRPAVQFSNNGVDWTDSPKELSASYVSAEGWNYGTGTADIFSLAGTTPRLFVRFGVQARNTSGSATESALVHLIVELNPVESATLPLPYQKVFSKGSTGTPNHIPVTGPVPTDGISAIRTTFELMSSSGDLQVQVSWQETNTPDDLSSWSSATAIGSSSSAEGITYGTSFGAISFTKKYFRICISAVNVSGAAIEAARVAVSVDLR